LSNIIKQHFSTKNKEEAEIYLQEIEDDIKKTALTTFKKQTNTVAQGRFLELFTLGTIEAEENLSFNIKNISISYQIDGTFSYLLRNNKKTTRKTILQFVRKIFLINNKHYSTYFSNSDLFRRKGSTKKVYININKLKKILYKHKLLNF
jgi:hypothetical protein